MTRSLWRCSVTALHALSFSLFLSLSSLTSAQTDANGQAITDDQLVNDANVGGDGRYSSNSDEQGGRTAILRDDLGHATIVRVEDAKKRMRREIKIRREDDKITTESTDYRRNGDPETSTTTEWRSDGSGRAIPTVRTVVIYDPVRKGPDGKPVPQTTYREEWRDGRWVREDREPRKTALRQHTGTGEIQVAIAGTGDTIGHIADLRLTNKTDKPLNVSIPPMVLESGSGKNQHYACPQGQEVAIAPHASKTVPVDGVCLVRSKPPVGKGVTGELLINDGNPTIAQESGSHIPAKKANDMLRVATSIYTAADNLLKSKQLEEIPYSDPKKKKDVVVQWATWMNPQIAELTGAPPATKEDLKKTVYKQLEKNGPMAAETKKKVDKGIDTIFEKVELTTAKAKDLEKPDKYAQGETGEQPPINVADHTPAPSSGDKPSKTKERLEKAANDYYDKEEEAFKDPSLKPAWDTIDKAYDLKTREKPSKEEIDKARKAIRKARRKFRESAAGKKALDDWEKAYQEARKEAGEGEKFPRDLIPVAPVAPPPAEGVKDLTKDAGKAETAQYNLDKKKYELKQAQKRYNERKEEALLKNRGVHRARDASDAAQASGDAKKAAEAKDELNRTEKAVEKDWQSSKEGKIAFEDLQKAEKEVEKAKEAYKPYEELEKFKGEPERRGREGF